MPVGGGGGAVTVAEGCSGGVWEWGWGGLKMVSILQILQRHQFKMFVTSVAAVELC